MVVIPRQDDHFGGNVKRPRLLQDLHAAETWHVQFQKEHIIFIAIEKFERPFSTFRFIRFNRTNGKFVFLTPA